MAYPRTQKFYQSVQFCTVPGIVTLALSVIGLSPFKVYALKHPVSSRNG